MATKKYASQRQVLGKISLSSDQTVTGLKPTDFADVFAQVSGGEISAAVEKIYRGGQLFPETLCAPAEIGDITLTDFVQHDDTDFENKMNILRQNVGRIYFDITVNVYDCGLVTPGAGRFYSRALLVGLTEADGDASSGAPAVFALTFSISTVAAVPASTATPAATTTTA